MKASDVVKSWPLTSTAICALASLPAVSAGHADWAFFLALGNMVAIGSAIVMKLCRAGHSSV